MYRAIVLTTLTLLLLAIAGITLARESTIGTESGSQTDVTVQDPATTTGEPTAITREPTDIADEGFTERSEPAAGRVTEESTAPEADEPEVTEDEATGAEEKNIGEPEGIGKPKGVGGKPVEGGKVKDNGGEAKAGEGQKKVTLCHKGKKTLAVGEPAQKAHLRHDDTLGVCQPVGANPEPSGKTTGPEAAKNGGGGSNGQQKVTLCHKGKTLTVGAPAREAHLRHGDTEGPCAWQ